MSVHVEWLWASDTTTQLISPGTAWVGADQQDDDSWVLTLATDDVVAIEGSVEDIIRLVLRMASEMPLPQAGQVLGDLQAENRRLRADPDRQVRRDVAEEIAQAIEAGSSPIDNSGYVQRIRDAQIAREIGGTR